MRKRTQTSRWVLPLGLRFRGPPNGRSAEIEIITNLVADRMKVGRRQSGMIQ